MQVCNHLLPSAASFKKPTSPHRHHHYHTKPMLIQTTTINSVCHFNHHHIHVDKVCALPNSYYYQRNVTHYRISDEYVNFHPS